MKKPPSDRGLFAGPKSGPFLFVVYQMLGDWRLGIVNLWPECGGCHWPRAGWGRKIFRRKIFVRWSWEKGAAFLQRPFRQVWRDQMSSVFSCSQREKCDTKLCHSLCFSFRYAAENSSPIIDFRVLSLSYSRSASSMFKGSFGAPLTVWPWVYISMSHRLPGSAWGRTPSRPAAKITACIREGLAAPSGRRRSNRPGPGTRTIWVRLLPVHVTVFGAHVAPDEVRGALIRL